MAASIEAEEVETVMTETVMTEIVMTEIEKIEIGDSAQAAIRLYPIELHSCSAANCWTLSYLVFRSFADSSYLYCRNSLPRNYSNCDQIFGCHLKRSLQTHDLGSFHFCLAWTRPVIVPASPALVVVSYYRWIERNLAGSPYLAS